MLTDMQREALEVALESIGRDEKCGPVGLGALCVIQDMLASSAAPAEGREEYLARFGSENKSLGFAMRAIAADAWDAAVRTTASTKPAEGRGPTVWAVYDGVCLSDIFQRESAATSYAKEMQKRHDLSGSFAAFHVEPRILATAPTMSEAARDSQRLDWMIEERAWVQWTVRDGSIHQCQIYTQDEDENYHVLSGDDRFFNTPREAIDAAIDRAAAKGGSDES